MITDFDLLGQNDRSDIILLTIFGLVPYVFLFDKDFERSSDRVNLIPNIYSRQETSMSVQHFIRIENIRTCSLMLKYYYHDFEGIEYYKPVLRPLRCIKRDKLPAFGYLDLWKCTNKCIFMYIYIQFCTWPKTKHREGWSSQFIT